MNILWFLTELNKAQSLKQANISLQWSPKPVIPISGIYPWENIWKKGKKAALQLKNKNILSAQEQSHAYMRMLCISKKNRKFSKAH